MKHRIYILLLLISSLFGYLEWGTDQNSFLFEVEYQLFIEALSNPSSFLHPFIAVPLAGQLLLLFAFFLRKPNKKLIYLGIVSIGLLLVFIVFVGIISGRLLVAISPIPFIIISILSIRYFRDL